VNFTPFTYEPLSLFRESWRPPCLEIEKRRRILKIDIIL
jgi:hypothetical protein